MQLNENCRKWNVKILEVNKFLIQIHRNKRHFDGSVNNELWTAIEEFLSLPRYREKNVNKISN